MQLFTVPPTAGGPTQLTTSPWGIASSFSWSPDGRWITCVADGSVCLVDATAGHLVRLTPPVQGDSAPRPEACVFSPDGTQIAYVRRMPAGDGTLHNQLFTVDVPRAC